MKDNNPHAHTDQCGFDRSSSIQEDTYVCTCGWREKPLNRLRDDYEEVEDFLGKGECHTKTQL